MRHRRSANHAFAIGCAAIFAAVIATALILGWLIDVVFATGWGTGAAIAGLVLFAALIVQSIVAAGRS